MTDEELIARLRDDSGNWLTDAAADRIEALVKDNRELVLQGLADSGQAQEAYEAQLRAEAQIATLTARVERLMGAAKRVLAPLDEPCRHDHHGYCQTHFIEAECSVAALRAALDTTDAAHVNETQNSEHDAGNVLTAAQAPTDAATEKGGDAHDRRLRSHEASPGVTAGADAAQAREAALMVALHDAVNAPKGVVPDSAVPFWNAAILRAMEGRDG